MDSIPNDTPGSGHSTHGADSATHRRFDRALRATLYRFDCPSADDLAAHAWGELSGARQRVIDTHLTICASCEAEHADFLAIRPHPQAAPSLSLGEVLDEVFDQWAEPVRRFIARLIPQDPTAQLALRGEADDAHAPRIYAVDEIGWQIVLMRDSSDSLSGQVLGPDEAVLAACRIGLVREDVVVSATQPDASGWFELKPIQAGAYSIWVDTPEQRIEIESGA